MWRVCTATVGQIILPSRPTTYHDISSMSVGVDSTSVQSRRPVGEQPNVPGQYQRTAPMLPHFTTYLPTVIVSQQTTANL